MFEFSDWCLKTSILRHLVPVQAIGSLSFTLLPPPVFYSLVYSASLAIEGSSQGRATGWFGFRERDIENGVAGGYFRGDLSV